LQQQFGVRINVEQPNGGPDRDVTLSGDPRAIEEAKQAIYDKIGMVILFSREEIRGAY
jgi:hypothetical protein